MFPVPPPSPNGLGSFGRKHRFCCQCNDSIGNIDEEDGRAPIAEGPEQLQQQKTTVLKIKSKSFKIGHHETIQFHKFVDVSPPCGRSEKNNTVGHPRMGEKQALCEGNIIKHLQGTHM